MVADWVFVLVGLAVVLWNRRIAGAVVALDRRIADVLRVAVVRRRAYTPFRPRYTRFALVFAGLMWAALGALGLLFFGVAS
jgi:hypothetical protein